MIKATLNNRPLYAKGTMDVKCFDPSTNDLVYYSNKMSTTQLQSTVNLGAINAGPGNPSPLDEPLPTPEQKLSLVFDPLRQTDPPDKAKLYRVFPQAYIAQTEYVGKTILRVYMGQTVARSVYRCELSVVFECLTNVVYEGAAGIALSRTFAMECALMEALNGVNINGVGTLYFDRTQHPGCGSWQIDDRGTNVGRRLVLGLTWGAS